MTRRHQTALAASVLLLLGALVVTGLAARREAPTSAASATSVAVVVPASSPIPSRLERSGRSTPRTLRKTMDAPAPGWVLATSSASGIPAPAIRAYGAATLTLGHEMPGCRLGWTTLAGIGDVESMNGTIGGRTLLADGRSSSPVVGPALGGVNGFRALAPTAASAAVHHDRRFDHAVGPLQFIGTTWRDWASDGDGDGRLDPLDIDDAALAAGRYLCADGRDLAAPEGWRDAVLSYNRSETYVVDVLGRSNAFARATG